MSHSRRSIELLSQISEEKDPQNFEKKHSELVSAIAEELKLFYEKQEQFEERIVTLEKGFENDDSPIRVKSHDKAKFTDLEDKINSLSESCLRKIEKLEKENKKLILLNNNLTKEIKEIEPSNNVEEQIKLLREENDQLYESIEKLKNEIKSKPQDTSLNIQSERLAKINITIPKFKGGIYERPIKFLSEFESYISVKNVSFDEFKLLLNQSLESDAKDWWYVNEDSIDNFEEFRNMFKERFWCSNIQRKIKRKIECGQYIFGSKMTRANYATHLFSLAKDLEANYTNEELIKLISAHFEREIRYTIKANVNNDKNEMFKILSEFDSDDKQLNRETQNQNKNQNQKDKDNNKTKESKNYRVNSTEVKKSDKNKNTKETKKDNNKNKQKGKFDEKSQLANYKYKDLDVLNIDLNSGNVN